jgi:uncharacterized membrane protein SirB2
MEMRELSLRGESEKLIVRLAKNFFTPYESWGRQNRHQFLVGLITTAGYFITNFFLGSGYMEWNPFINSSNGLLISVFICVGLILFRFTMNFTSLNYSKYPWYEKYMPMIITLLGLVTLIAFQNLDGKGADDAGLWINIVVLLIIFIIAAGYFVEGRSNERIIKIWFALFGYYLSVVAFFYFFEKWLFNNNLKNSFGLL